MIVIEKNLDLIQMKSSLDAVNTRAHAGKSFKMLTDMNEALIGVPTLTL